MLTQSISNSLLKEFVQRKSEIDFIEAERSNHPRSGIKREAKSPHYFNVETELETTNVKKIRGHEFGLKQVKTEIKTEAMPTDSLKSLSSVLTPSTDVLARNYSDIMRSLAAKYNNSAEDRLKYFSDEPLQSVPLINNKSKGIPTVFENQLPIESTINPISLFTGLSLSSGIIPHILDMSSTQALITLVSCNIS